MASNDLLPLADVLSELGRELRRAARRGGRTLEFYGAEVELEIEVVRSAEGSIGFWVLEAGGSASRKTGTRIRVSVGPHRDFDQSDGVGM